MRRILFVDDEPKLLDGLRRMLRGMRDEWEMEFAESGQEALALLERTPFHAVVTDMRMPGMDGARLLDRVKHFYPQVVRIILSGYSDREMILKSVGLAHQYLSKPCDAQTLKTTITRACSMRVLLEDQELIRVISGIESLPSLPSLYSEIVQELNAPESSLNRVGELISLDVGMSAKILQLVNSAFFGLARRISSPAKAVSLLGLENVKALVLTVKIFSQFEKPGPIGHFAAELWKHSLMTGVIAKKLAQKERLSAEDTDDAFMAGLLHDIGKLILMDRFAEKWAEIINVANSDNCDSSTAEQQVIGTTHARIGAYLLGIWGLSENIVKAVAYHHNPDDCPDILMNALTAVHLADAIERRAFCDRFEITELLSLEYLEKLGIADRIDHYLEYADSLCE